MKPKCHTEGELAPGQFDHSAHSTHFPRQNLGKFWHHLWCHQHTCRWYVVTKKKYLYFDTGQDHAKKPRNMYPSMSAWEHRNPYSFSIAFIRVVYLNSMAYNKPYNMPWWFQMLESWKHTYCRCGPGTTIWSITNNHKWNAERS